MRSNKFIRIAKKYYFSEKLSKKERNEFIELADEFRSKEDISKVLFFVDFDFFGIKIFNSIKTKKKEIFLPDNIEELIKNSGSQEKYLEQNCKVELNSKNSKKLYELIKKHSKILFQEILDVS